MNNENPNPLDVRPGLNSRRNNRRNNREKKEEEEEEEVEISADIAREIELARMRLKARQKQDRQFIKVITQVFIFILLLVLSSIVCRKIM